MESEAAGKVIGSLFEGRYRVLEPIGRGGMGGVYLSEDTRLKRRCALKILHDELAPDRTNVERFLREAQMIASLEHRNIVDIFSFGEEPPGRAYFVMELLSGEDLDARLKQRGERPFDVHDCCVWALQIAQAVAVVHEAGLIHRDLKASNVFLARQRDGEEICKLLDFGIARAEDGSELTKTGVTLGTPSYMSPEQVRNIDVDRRSDIYSFGVLLFKMITGKVPFTGEPIQVAMQHCTVPAPAPSKVAPAAGITAGIDAIVLKAMEKEPCDRFQSMREVEAALLEVLRVEAPELAPVAKPVRTTSHSSLHVRPSTGPLPTVAPPVVAPPLDAVTPGTSPLQSVTAVMSTPPASPSPTLRRMFVVTGVVLLGALGVAVAVLTAGKEPAPSAVPAPPVAARAAAVAPAPKPEPAPPKVEPAPPPAVEARAVAPAPVVDEPGELPPLEPEVPVRPVSTRSDGKGGKPTASVDPLKQIERKAAKCRKAHKSVDGPKITIDYAVGIDGKVTRSIPSTADALGTCLADAVRSTQFEPKLVIGRKLAL